MSAVEWLESQLVYCWYQNEVEDWEKAKQQERNQIIRAVNFSIMNLDKLREQAIKENKTIGEIYYENYNDKNNPRT